MMKPKKLSVAFFCIIILFSFTAAQETGDTQDKVAEAEQLLENLNAQAAKELLDEVLAEDSVNAEALYTYHKVELMYGNLTEAQSLVRKAIEYQPSKQEYRDKFDELRDMINQLKDAQREVDSDNYDVAKRIFNELIENNSSIAELYYRLGFIAIQEENYDEARENFDRASILAPNVEKYARAKNILAGKILQEAQVSLSRGDLSTAQRKAETSLRINPEFGSAYAVLGYIKLRSGDINSAIENLEKAVEYNPDSRSSWYNLGNIYRRREQYEKAKKALLRTIELDSNYSRAYTALGQTFLAENKLEEAENYLKKSIELNPDSPAARESYGELLNTQERYGEAIEHLTAATEMIRNPRDKYLTNYRLAYAYNRSGKYKKALNAAKEVTNANPRFGGGWFERGVAHAKMGETQDAINAFNKGRSDRNWRGIIEPERERLLTGKELSF
ncbi:MAG: tetratricopeptide repeat protein [Fidelibacterota bacterium]